MVKTVQSTVAGAHSGDTATRARTSSDTGRSTIHHPVYTAAVFHHGHKLGENRLVLGYVNYPPPQLPAAHPGFVGVVYVTRIPKPAHVEPHVSFATNVS